MADTEEGMGEKEEIGSDRGTGGTLLSEPPPPGAQDTGASEERSDDSAP